MEERIRTMEERTVELINNYYKKRDGDTEVQKGKRKSIKTNIGLRESTYEEFKKIAEDEWEKEQLKRGGIVNGKK